MDIHLILGIVGGLGLFVFGMHILCDSLTKLTHELNKTMLESLTDERVRSSLVGMAAAAVTLGSTSLSVTVAGFLNAGIIQFTAALAVMAGANIGTTATAHIIASNLQGVAPFFVFAGALFYFMAPKTQHQNRGLAIFGFGILFLGLDMMASAMSAVAAETGLHPFFSVLSSSPAVAVPAGIVLAVLLRAGGTAAGLVIALALGGMVDLAGALYLVFGINLGTCFNSIIASVGSHPAHKQVALGNLLFNGAALVIALAAAPLFLNHLPAMTESLPRQIALAHTAFNVIVLIIALPLLGGFTVLLKKIIPGEGNKKQEIRYLSRNLLSTPYLAIMAVIRELTVMLSICQGMLNKAETCVVTAYNHKLKNELIFEEESVDEMQKNITDYLVEITRNDLTHRQQQRIPALLHSVNDLEKVADYCESIVILAQRIFEDNLTFSGGAREELERLFAKTRTMMKLTMQAIDENDQDAAQITLTIKREIDELIAQYKLNHVSRLEAGICANEPGLVFSDILTAIDHMNSHLLNITKGVLHLGKR